MKISQQLKEKNIAEYLIYMWQVEDLLRANKCDIDLIRSNVISRYPAEEKIVQYPGSAGKGSFYK